MIYLQLFWVFFKQGLLGFGGGYAMLSLMQYDVVERYHWVSPAEFADIVALSQMTPGPVCINAATYVGYHAAFESGYGVGGGIAGSLLASLSVCLPSLFLIWLVMAFLMRHKQHPVVRGVLRGLKLVSVALIASVAVMMMNAHNFVDAKSVCLFAGVFAASFHKKFSPIAALLLCAALGYLLYGL